MISSFGIALSFLQIWKVAIWYGPVCSLRDSVSMRYKFTSSCWHCARIWWGSQPSARLEVTGKDVGMKIQEEERLRREGGIYVLTIVPS